MSVDTAQDMRLHPGGGPEGAWDGVSRKVIEHRGGPLLVLGGPGSGKTTLLEARLLHLACEEDLAPHRILFLCNNRRYSTDARERLVWALPQEATLEVPVYTWHGLAYHLVSRYYPVLGYQAPPVLLTGPEQWATVRELLAGERPEDWQEWAPRLGERAFVDEVADFCLRAEQRLDQQDDLEALQAARPSWAPVVRFYNRYRSSLRTQSRLDYAGLIAEAVRLLEGNDQIRTTLQRRFPHVLVDEGQEMSGGQRRLLQTLETANLTVAADPDSGIEMFRGAEPDWVFGFGKWFGGFEQVVLDRSHRVGSPLFDASLELVRHNDAAAGHHASLGAEHQTEYDCRLFSSGAEEADSIARELKRRHVFDRVPWSQMAVLISQPRYLLTPLERALDAFEVPHQPMTGDRPLATEPAVRGFLDLVRVALGHDGAGELLPRVLTGPLTGLGYPQRRKMEREAWQSGRSLSEIVEESEEAGEFRKLRDLVVHHQQSADECFWQVYSASKYFQSAEAAAGPGRPGGPDHEAERVMDSLVAFSHALGRFVERRHGEASIVEYLNEAARADFGGEPWQPPAPEGSEGVAVVSFHGAKGREWDTVVVAGCLDAWIPKGRRAQGLFDPFALETPDISQREIEAIADDRRTFYVAATRARSRVLFTVSPSGGGRARPSRFLAELSGRAPEEASEQELPPLTSAEMAAKLRRVLAADDSAPEERVAALLGLSQLPGADPSRWYGRWGWTSGRVPLVEDRLRTSYSRLGVYENCGLQYVLQSVLGLDPSSTYSMKFGTWIHALFQAVHESRITTAQELRAQYEQLFDERIFPGATIARQFKRDGEKMLRVFWENERDRHTVKAEHSFELPFGDAVLRGRIDRVDLVPRPAASGGGAEKETEEASPSGTLKLTDYKTAKWALSFAKAKKSLQLAIYHHAAAHDPELKKLGKPGLARLVYPGALNREGKHFVLTQTPEQADEVLKSLPEMISKIVAEDFRPSPRADCYFCNMKPLCPLWPEGRELEA